MASRLSLWLLLAAISPVGITGSPVSLAQVTRDEGAAANAIDQAVRTGDFSRAATVLRKAAESGNAEAQYRLASLYRSGRGVPQDELQAFKWMKAAAEQNHMNAEFNLATMYLAGRGVAADVGQATVWLKKAASRGHGEAVKLLAEISTRRVTDPSPANSAQTQVPEERREPTRIETSARRSV